mmetsp:Transcript_16855/g.16727  ORF Transcript_16855/g.16727 Transcript_16855/m.16727 type:complete len:82 (-) Transcript_16855:114-359(-)
MATEVEVVTIYAGVRGYLDKIAQKEIPRFETMWLEHVSQNHPDILKAIRAEHLISDTTEENLKNAMEEFLTINEFEARAAH